MSRSTHVILVGGPTASGKSALALALARACDGVVINADSMQVYRDLRVLSARPGPDDEAAAPHRLYGVLPATERGSAGLWRTMAMAEIEAAWRQGRLPIVVGGTGLYLRVLEAGIAPVPAIPDGLRAALRAAHAELGDLGLHRRLADRDPETAARLAPADVHRVLRALEVVEATGRSLSAFQAEQVAPPPLPCHRILVMPPRAALVAAIDRRCAAMLDAGALEEVAALLATATDPDLPVRKAVGVPELARHLAGEESLEATLAQFRQATRRYAKRQVTWFRHQFPATMTIDAQFSESLMPKIIQFIREND
jgi:tRNA dimethylallyltransferase